MNVPSSEYLRGKGLIQYRYQTVHCRILTFGTREWKHCFTFCSEEASRVALSSTGGSKLFQTTYPLSVRSKRHKARWQRAMCAKPLFRKADAPPRWDQNNQDGIFLVKRISYFSDFLFWPQFCLPCLLGHSCIRVYTCLCRGVYYVSWNQQ